MCPSGMARRGRARRCSAGARAGRRCPSGRRPLQAEPGRGSAAARGQARRGKTFARPGLGYAPRPGAAGAAVLPKPCAAAAAATAAGGPAVRDRPGACGKGAGSPARARRAADGPALINAPATCGMCARAAARGRSRPPRRHRPAPSPPTAARAANGVRRGGAGPRGTRGRGSRTCAGGGARGPARPRSGRGSAIEELSRGMAAATPGSPAEPSPAPPLPSSCSGPTELCQCPAGALRPPLTSAYCSGSFSTRRNCCIRQIQLFWARNKLLWKKLT